MRIILTERIEGDSSLNDLLKALIQVCKNEIFYDKKEKIKKIDEEITNEIYNYKKRQEKLEKIREAIKTLQQKFETLQKENEQYRKRLLKELGSEL